MSDNPWTQLGLSHNPFAEPQREFFPGADREVFLGRLRHLHEWSQRMLVVTGPHGVGKTSLFRALSGSLEPQVHAARVNGSLVSRAGEVLEALVEGFGIPAPDAVDTQMLNELTVSFLREGADAQQSNLILVDDAHLLEQGAIDDLVALAMAGAHLLFFSEPQFIEVLERALERGPRAALEAMETGTTGDLLAQQQQPELQWHEMLLSPFSREQTGDYLEWRFAEAGFGGGMPYNDAQVNRIYADADGYPGRTNHAANEELVLMQAGGGATGGIPQRHMYLAGGLAVLLGLLWFLVPIGDEPIDEELLIPPSMQRSAQEQAAQEQGASGVAGTDSGEAQPATALPGAPADAPTPVPQTPNRRAPRVVPNAAAPVARTEPAPTATPAAVTASTTVAAANPTTNSGSTTRTPAVVSTTPAIPASSRPAPAAAQPRPTAAQTRPPAVQSTPVASTTATAPVASNQPAASTPRARPTVAATPPPAPAPVPQRTAATSTPAPAATTREPAVGTPEPAVSPASSSSGVRSASWLLQQSANGFTIQLVGFGEAANAQAYLGRQRDLSQYSLFKVKSGDNIVHVVTYGYFTDRAAAERAVTQLPASIGNINPWVRPMRSVHDAIRTAVQTPG